MATPAKKSKSRFTDLVKFVPEDEEEPVIRSSQPGIQTHKFEYEEKKPVKRDTFTISNDDTVKEEYIPEKTKKEEYIPEVEDIPEIEAPTMEDEYFDEDIDSRDIANDLNVEPEVEDADIEEEIEEIEEVEEETNNTEDIKAMQNESIEAPKNINETIILGNTTIQGNIITDTGIQIYGAVLGNIESQGRVQLIGKVEGNITGKSVIVTNTRQTGDITAETEVQIKEGCHIEGDIAAEHVVLKGSVKGNIKATGQVDFESSSEIEGNVSAHSFNIKPGAKINGSISTN